MLLPNSTRVVQSPMALRYSTLQLLRQRLQSAVGFANASVNSHGIEPFLIENWPLCSRCTYSSSPLLGSRSHPQYDVLKPAGGGGPILRTAVYAVFELGSAQYKVSAGDLVYAERLTNVGVGAELSLRRVQAAGSRTETLVGRPYVEGATVTAVVEEQVQDAKVISFKKRRRKNSRRTKGHRQYLTGLRITGINGIMASEIAEPQKVVA